MPSLYEMLDNAHDGEGMAALGREFGLTPTQTEAAVAALLPAISTGLKQSTATLDGLGNLFGVMGQQQNLQAMYDNPETAFGPEGLAAGKDALSVIFGSPDVSRAVIDQAQNFSGVSSNILKKMLPVLAGGAPLGTDAERIFWKGRIARNARPLGRRRPRRYPGPDIRARGMPGSSSAPAGPAQQFPPPASQPPPLPTDAGGQPTPEGDILGSILRELEKGIEMAASNRSLSAGDLYIYPCRANNKVRCPPVPTPHGCRAATSLAKSYAMCLAEPWGAPPKCRKGDRDSHRR